MRLLIKNAAILGRGKQNDILIEDGVIAGIGHIETEGCRVIDASGLVAVPGLCDIHCHLREPGQEYKEDIASGAASAAAGGFADICCMPNTSPVIDTPERVAFVLERAGSAGGARVHPIAAATVGLGGAQLSDYQALASAGAAAFSDDGRPVLNDAVMRAALISAFAVGKVVCSHCEKPELTAGGAINEGEVSMKLGVGGIPKSAEDIMIARDILLAEENGVRVHICHVSTKSGVQIIREAKARGAKVTAETCPHYFSLTEKEVERFGANAKMSPPLRTEEDRRAVIEGLRDGTIDCIATDHAPHAEKEKARGLAQAPNGIVGFETAFALANTILCKNEGFEFSRLAELMCENPRRVLGLAEVKIEEGFAADITLVAPDEKFEVDAKSFKSKSKNTPFDGVALSGAVKHTIIDGNEVYSNVD